MRRTITIELEVEGPHAEPDHVVRWLRRQQASSTDWWVVEAEAVAVDGRKV